MATATQTPARAASFLKNQSIKVLCNMFEDTNKLDVDSEAAMVRGWIMDELEARDESAFDAWIFSENTEDADKPSKFFN